MFRLRLLFIAILIASSNLPEALCFEQSRIEHHGQIFEHQYESNEEQAGLQSAPKKSTGDPQDDDHSLFPRNTDLPERWQQNIDKQHSGLHIPDRFDLDQVPKAFRKIYKSCLELREGHPSNIVISKCIINKALKAFPPNSHFKAAKTVAFDLLRKGNGIYTPKTLLGATVRCRELLKDPHSLEASPREFIPKCFFHLLVQMHPLKQYAIVAIQDKATSFFEHVARVCHTNKPKELKGKREINKYYLQCFIDTASAKYEDNLLVHRGREWLTPYIKHPDSKFNQEKIIDVAEFCEEETENFPLDKKATAAFFCFYRSLLSLHPQTKQLADNLIRQMGINAHKTEQTSVDNRPKTPERNHSPSKSAEGHHRPNRGTSASNRPKSPERNHSTTKSGESHHRPNKSTSQTTSENGVSTPRHQRPTNSKALAECMLKEVASLPIADQVLSSVTSYLPNIPKLGGFFGNQSPGTAAPSAEGLGKAVSPDVLKSFVKAATPCFGLIKRDENGKLVLDQGFAIDAATEVVKLHPMGAFAVGSAQAVAENVSVTQDGEGKPQYNINYEGLAIGLGKAALKSTKFGQIAAKFMR